MVASEVFQSFAVPTLFWNGAAHVTWEGMRTISPYSSCLFVCLFACWFVGISHHDALQGSGLMKVCGGVLIFFEFSTNYRRAFLAWPRLSMCEPCPVGATCRGGLAPPVSDPGAPLERFGFIREMVCNTWRNFLDDICRTNISEMNGVAMEGCGTEVVPQISMNENRTSWILPLGFKSVIYNHRPENFPKSGCHDLKKNCKSGGNVDSALTGLLRCKIWTNLGSHTFLQKNTCDMWMFPFVMFELGFPKTLGQSSLVRMVDVEQWSASEMYDARWGPFSVSSLGLVKLCARPHTTWVPKWWWKVRAEIPLFQDISGKSRLVKYFNLVRWVVFVGFIWGWLGWTCCWETLLFLSCFALHGRILHFTFAAI